MLTGCVDRDHPRIRGEHRAARVAPGYPCGSSPHPRGALSEAPTTVVEQRIIPASAGSTQLPCDGIKGMRDHPRIRGEHHRRGGVGHQGTGSSPHPRGAPGPPWSGGRPSGIIPASAGSTTVCRCRRTGTKDHPRIRGEHHFLSFPFILCGGSSPHPRGALHSREVRI